MKILLTILLLVASTNVFAAHFPLEITNIKPAGTGTPAIPSTNRIFRAYPGVEYNVRAAVIGGLYPFTYSLSGQPIGMVINPTTGEITWTNPQVNSGTITLSVTDAENTTVTASWAITVSTSGFLFVDANAVSNGTGTLASPFKTLANMVAGTSAANNSDIVYFRGGNYDFVQNTTGGAGQPEMTLSVGPYTWLGYPGENASVRGNGVRGRFYKIYLDNLNFSGFGDNGIVAGGGENYNTIRRTKWDNLVATISHVENQGFVTLLSGDPHGFYTVIQDNEFTNFTGGAAIGSLYDIEKALIENNYIHGDGGPGVSGIDVGIGTKHGNKYLSVRKNKVIMTHGFTIGTNMDSQLADSSYIDISFNYFKITPSSYNEKAAHSFNGYGYGELTIPPGYIEDPFLNGMYYRSIFNFKYHRNTLVGHIRMGWIDGGNCWKSGPFEISGNVIINDNTDYSSYHRMHDFIAYSWDRSPLTTSPWLCITDTNNLKATSGLIDSNGLLLNRDYVDIYGWEVSGNPPTVYGTCGSANWQTFSTTPTTGLCSVGTASPVTGQYNWTCTADTVANCSASYSAPAPASVANRLFGPRLTGGVNVR